ncbi:MAG: hypothetical protein HC802_08765 [Caldilineaceae bacterium]|nr:hypothetical protein [Caldilineaceae bacterium]
MGGGAGVYCFMVGVGQFEFSSDGAARFAVHQLFMRNPAEEPALLTALADLLGGKEVVVTFNGRSFDLPLLRTRYRQNQGFLPNGVGLPGLLEPGRAHLDLLHPARQLWRRRLQSCRLINLEQHILGLLRSEDDVPGHMIPLLYTQYVQSGNAGPMANVFYHNQEDIVSMVGIAERLAAVFEPPPDQLEPAELDGLEWLALARCYDNVEEWALAEPAYRRALERVRRPDDQREIFDRLAQLLRRQERWEAAAEVWQEWLSTVPGADPLPYVELAKYYEWQVKDLEQAEMWAGWALHNLAAAPRFSARASQIAELEHRLARLQRKRSGSGASSGARLPPFPSSGSSPGTSHAIGTPSTHRFYTNRSMNDLSRPNPDLNPKEQPNGLCFPQRRMDRTVRRRDQEQRRLCQRGQELGRRCTVGH